MSNKFPNSVFSCSLIVFFGLWLNVVTAIAQTTVFTYQGKLSNGGNPATGNYDFQFSLFDALSEGTPQGTTQTLSNVTVTGGIFTVPLDFGANVFTGAGRYLEIGVRPAGSPNPYTTLAPRQAITSTPYAIQTLKASTASALSSDCVGCVQDAQINAIAASKITGTLSVPSIPAGSANYIQNTAIQQTAANFNIDGNGLIGGNVGIGTPTPQSKLEVQLSTDNYGITHTDGTTRLSTYINSGLGGAGGIGTASSHPLFFFAANTPTMFINPGSVGIGTSSPQSRFHVLGTSWFQGDTTPLPPAAGQGVGIGFLNNSGAGYVFAYDYASNTPKPLSLNLGGNVGVGTLFPQARFNVNGTSWFQGDTTPLFFTAGAGVAIGYSASSDAGYILANNYSTSTGKSLVLNSTGGNVGIGTFTPQARLNIVGTSFFQGGTTQLPSTAGAGVSIGYSSGLNTGAIFAYDYTAATPKNLALNSTGGNVGIGTTAPAHRLAVTGGPTWTSTGWTGALELDNGSAIAWRSNTSGNRFGVGHTNGGLFFFTSASDPGTTANPSDYQMVLLDVGNVGIGTPVPGHKLTVQTTSNNTGISHTDGTVDVGTYIGTNNGPLEGFLGTFTAHTLNLVAGGLTGLGISTNGLVHVPHFGASGSTQICFNGSFQLSLCSSSLRYKTNLAPYSTGLQIINRLRPITFDWKQGGMHDVGFGAEDVAGIEPLFVTHNQEGQVEGVKYDRLSVVFVNAIKEQQAQIEDQHHQITDLRNQLEQMRQLLCQEHSTAKLCQPGKNK